MLVELLLIVASVLHAAFAAYFLYRNVERMTRWDVTLMRATLEQLRVCALGLLLAFGLIAAVSATARLRDEIGCLMKDRGEFFWQT